MKKYRLKINYSEITEENFNIAQFLRKNKLDGELCQEDKSLDDMPKNTECVNFGDLGYFCITKSWLTEIKEALNFEGWYRRDSVNENPISREEFLNREKIWNAAIENYKLSQDQRCDGDILSELYDKTGVITGPLQERITTETVKNIYFQIKSITDK